MALRFQDVSRTGKLGSLEMSDKRCQELAVASGIGDHTFRAYLSTSTVDAKSRMGSGPWHNSKGALIAPDLAELHSGTLKGDGGNPNEHDILTGTNAGGTKATATCQDWTSDSGNDKGQVACNSGHQGGSCADTTVAGGKGRIYCLAID